MNYNFEIGVNRTYLVQSDDGHALAGFGGSTRFLMGLPIHKIQLGFGLSIDRFKWHKEKGEWHNLYKQYDVNYTGYYISMPLWYRRYLDEYRSYYIDLGASLDMHITNGKGTYRSGIYGHVGEFDETTGDVDGIGVNIAIGSNTSGSRLRFGWRVKYHDSVNFLLGVYSQGPRLVSATGFIQF